MNRLLFGDNLRWLRDGNVFSHASVDLIYLEPPFNSTHEKVWRKDRLAGLVRVWGGAGREPVEGDIHRARATFPGVAADAAKAEMEPAGVPVE